MGWCLFCCGGWGLYFYFFRGWIIFFSFVTWFPLLPSYSLLIGTDDADLLLQRDFRPRQNKEPTAVKNTLIWIFMGGSKGEGENSSCNYISNSLTNIDKKTQNFWKLERYGTLLNMSLGLIPSNEKRSLEILQKNHQK